MKYGWLSFPPHEKSLNPRQIQINTFKDRNIEETFNPSIVCFSDIPKNELKIHISKYSKFGIAFQKNFLIERGANPVFYIEENSTTYNDNISSLGKYESTNRVEYYNEFSKKALFNIFHKQLNDPKYEKEYPDILESYLFLVNVFSHFKVWDNSLDDDNPQNYYFEREWRAINNINFQLSDVVMVIIPKNYETKFKLDFPEYIDKYETVEDIIKAEKDSGSCNNYPCTE